MTKWCWHQAVYPVREGIKMIAKVLIVVALILAVLAFFGLGIGDLNSTRELALSCGCLAVAALL